jgi:PAS domain S-box-containing protein
MKPETSKSKAQLIAELQELRSRFVLAQQQAAQELAYGRQLLRTVLDNLPVSVYAKDLHGRKILANRVDLEIVGRPEGEVLGKTDAELFPAEVAEQFWKDDQSILSSGQAIRNHEELGFNHSQGRHFWQLTSKVPLYDASGKLTGLVGIGLDITERKSAEGALRASEERYRSLIERMRDGVYRSTHAGDFVDINPAMVTMFGYDSKEEMMAVDIKNELYFDANDRGNHSLYDGQQQTFDVYRMRRKDGSEIWVEDRAFYTYDERGEILYHEGILRDVTERVRQEQSLRASEEKFRKAFNISPDSININRLSDAAYISINQGFTRITGYTEGEALGRTSLELRIWEDPQERERLLQELKENGVVNNIETRLRTKNGEIKDALISASVIELEGEPHILSVTRDISERKRMEAAIQKSRNMLHLVLDTIPQRVFWKDPNGYHLGCNMSFARSVGLEHPSQVVGKTDFELADSPHLAKLYQADDRIILENNRPKYHVVEYFQQSDGKIQWLDSTKIPLIDESGRAFAVLGILEDITERKRAEEQLRESEKRLRTMLDISLAMSATLEMNTILQKVVENAAGFLGLASGAIYTLQGDELFLEATTPPLPAGFPDVFRRVELAKHPHIQAAISRGSTVVVPDKTVAELSEDEKMVMDARGLRSIAFIPLMISDKAIGILIVASVDEVRAFSDEEIALYAGFAGQAAQTIENIRLYQSEREYAARLEAQIAERKQAENTLRERESLLRIAGQTAQFGGWSVDLGTGKVTWSEQVALIHDKEPGYSPNVDEGMQFYAPEWRDKITRVFNACVQEGTPYDEEMEIITTRGRRVWVRTIGHAVRDGSGKVVRVQGSFQDITQRKNSEHDLEAAYDSTLRGWSSALELREHETAGHSQRVVEVTLDLARRMGVDEENLVHIQRGALLHDIGKMGIPDSILLKPGPLNDDEWVTMRQHPKFAYCMLSKIDYLKPALEIPYCHHEKWDGDGYPRGLKGEGIPLSARIFAVVDSWDALSHDRPYRPAWPREAVIKHLKKQSGRQFDPQVVCQFVALVGNG